MYQSQECKNPRRQVTLAKYLCSVAPNICGTSVWNIYFTFPAPRFLSWLLAFWNSCTSLMLLRPFALLSSELYIRVTVHCNRFLLNNQPDALIITILFCYKTLHVSCIFSAHHQDFSTVHSTLVSFMQVSDDRFHRPRRPLGKVEV